MKQALQLKIGQSLSMTPHMQQAIRMLQLSTLELRTEIQQILDINPFLEVEEPQDHHEQVEREQTESDSLEPQSNEEYEQRLFEQADWQSSSVHRSSKSNTTDDWAQNTNADEDTLQGHLLQQLNLARLSMKDQIIGSVIIESIDVRGFLTQSLQELLPITQIHWQEHLKSILRNTIAEQNLPDDVTLTDDNTSQTQEITLEETKVVLLRIQHFDPPGVGASSTAECLALQLKLLRPEQPFQQQALHLIEQHGKALETQNIKVVLKESGYSLEEIHGALHLLRTLEVAPGERCCPTQIEYVIPDVIAYKYQGQWQVTLNPEVSPKLKLSPVYDSLMPKNLAAPDQEYVKTHMQEAKWFLKSLQSRHATLLKIASDIVDCQRDFFEEGETGMKPLILADVANRVEMHESTVSRVTTQKYIHTPRGVFELKYFFSSHVSTDDGGECSSTAIRAQIKQLIAKETPEKPLSDNKIAKLLEKNGINIARRTVAKYRELDKIPSSNERKKTF